jgi:hypothetical protein
LFASIVPDLTVCGSPDIFQTTVSPTRTVLDDGSNTKFLAATETLAAATPATPANASDTMARAMTAMTRARRDTWLLKAAGLGLGYVDAHRHGCRNRPEWVGVPHDTIRSVTSRGTPGSPRRRIQCAFVRS